MRKKVIGIALAFLCFSFTSHILKMSNTTISAENGKLKIHLKIFADDLTETEGNRQKVKANFCKATLTSEDKKIVAEYVKKNFVLYRNGVVEPIDFLDAKTDTENPDNIILNVFFQSRNKVQLKKGDVVKIKNTILFRDIPEQKNMVTLINLIESEIEVVTLSNLDGDITKEIKY